MDTIQNGGNIKEVKKEVRRICDAINSQKLKRSEINEEIAALRAEAETLGIHKAALDMAMRYMGWDPEKREGFDLAFSIVREVMGLPIKNDLFSIADKSGDKAKADKEPERLAVAGESPGKMKSADGTAANEADEQAEGDNILDGHFDKRS